MRRWTPRWRSSNLAVLLGFLWPDRWPAAWMVLLGVLASVFETVSISLLIPVLQSLSHDGQPPALTTGHGLLDSLSSLFATVAPLERLRVIVGVMLALILLKNLLAYLLTVSAAWLRSQVERRLSLAVFDHLMRVSYRSITQRSVGELLTQLTTEPQRCGAAVQGLVEMVATLCLVAAYSALLLILSWPLTLAAAVVLLGLSLLLRWPAHWARSVGEGVSRTSVEVAHASVEALEGMRVVRAFGQETPERERFQRRLYEKTGLQVRSAQLSSLPLPVAETLSVVFLAALALLAALRLVAQSGLVIPLLLTFVFVLYRLLPRVAYLSERRINLALCMAGAEAVARVLATHDKPYVANGSRSTPPLRRGIWFERVSFAYGAGQGMVLNDLDFHIPAGRTTAIVGVSGVGKTTLVDLILRFYDPDAGRITVDGVDLRELDVVQWRAALGVVMQDTFLFHATVRDNIAYGRAGAGQEAIAAAARQAHAHEFITALPHGYDTVVGDRGVRLSAGQRQRLAIARAVLRDPKLLILDEATSALDSASEWHVQQALRALGTTCTVLVIAHRLSAVVHADQIIVLKDGRVVEQGTHAELLARGEGYAEFWRLQSASPEPAVHAAVS